MNNRNINWAYIPLLHLMHWQKRLVPSFKNILITRCTLIFVFLFSVCLLFAQTTKLPDFEVTGTGSIRSFLYKKSFALNSATVSVDSLSPFLPPSLPLIKHQPLRVKQARALMVASYDYPKGIDLSYSRYQFQPLPQAKSQELRTLHPQHEMMPVSSQASLVEDDWWNSIDLLKFRIQHSDDEFTTLRSDLYLSTFTNPFIKNISGGRPSPNSYESLKTAQPVTQVKNGNGQPSESYAKQNTYINYYLTRYLSFKQSQFQTGTAFETPSLDAGFFSFMPVELDLAFSHFNQDNGTKWIVRPSLDIMAKQEVTIANEVFAGLFSMVNWHPAVSISYSTSYLRKRPWADTIKFVLLADQMRVLPSVAYSYDYIPNANSTFALISKPALAPNQAQELSRRFGILAMDADLKPSKIPLDVLIQYSASIPPKTILTGTQDQTKTLVRVPKWYRLSAWMTSLELKLIYDDVVPLSASNYFIPDLNYSTVFSATPGISLKSVINEQYKITQSFSTGLDFLADRNWIRKPYSPLFNFKTSYNENIYGFDTHVTITQAYNIIDHAGKHLPEIIDLTLGSNYKLSNDTYLTARIENILGLRQYTFRTFQARKADLYIGFDHRF